MKSTSKVVSRTKPAVRASRVAEPATAKLAMPTKREIATRAYELYAHAGYQAGREVEFWLEAERQLLRGPRK